MPGAILSTGILACAAALTIAYGTVGAAAAAGQRIAGAADTAALAAADAASGAVAGDPCERARQVAAADGAAVTACTLDGLDATVRVSAGFGAWQVVATARAGPPR